MNPARTLRCRAVLEAIYPKGGHRDAAWRGAQGSIQISSSRSRVRPRIHPRHRTEKSRPVASGRPSICLLTYAPRLASGHPAIERQARLLAQKCVDAVKLIGWHRPIQPGLRIGDGPAVVRIVRRTRVELGRHEHFRPVQFLPRRKRRSAGFASARCRSGFRGIRPLRGVDEIIHPVLSARSAAEIEELSTLHLARAALQQAVAAAIHRGDEQARRGGRAEEHRGRVASNCPDRTRSYRPARKFAPAQIVARPDVLDRIVGGA